MKCKLLLSSILTGVLYSGASVASTGTVQFIGSVTDSTCDFVVEHNGVIGNQIDLGAASKAEFTDGNVIKEVDFRLVAQDQAGKKCTPTGQADVTWAPKAWGFTGFKNFGTAKGVEIVVSGDNKKVTQNSPTVAFTTGDLTSLPFKAGMYAGNAASVVVGTVLSTASFAVAYK